MSHVIVVEFVSLDGVMEDPDGSGGSPRGGWAFRYGRPDPFGLGEVLRSGALLLGRHTWQQFAGIWPGRDDPFSAQLNAKRKQEQDIVVMGSTSVVRTLMARDLVDEYRLLVFPLVLGTGTRLFPDGTAPADLALVSAQARGAVARLVYTRS